MAIDNLIITSINKNFKDNLYDELVIGKLANVQSKADLKKGDEMNVEMPATVEMFKYSGGDLPDAELVTQSYAKVRVEEGEAFHFEIDRVKQQQILAAKTPTDQLELVKVYGEDATKQYAAHLDAAFGGLYTRAGHYLANNDGSAINLDADYAKEILAYMQAEFQRGDKKGHTNWRDGQMVCIVPPEYQFYLGKLDELKYTESAQRKVEKGFIGKLCGWDILVSNNVAKDDDGNFYPLFGLRGKTLAGGVSKDLNTTSYMPEKNFNTRYKGYGLYGVGAPRADFLGAVKIAAPLKLANRA